MLSSQEHTDNPQIIPFRLTTGVYAQFGLSKQGTLASTHFHAFIASRQGVGNDILRAYSVLYQKRKSLQANRPTR